jgi:hypothetical protein
MRMAAMFVFTTTRLAQKAGVLSPWFARAGMAAGLFLLLSTTFHRALVLVFPLWLVVLCLQFRALADKIAPTPLSRS